MAFGLKSTLNFDPKEVNFYGYVDFAVLVVSIESSIDQNGKSTKSSSTVPLDFHRCTKEDRASFFEIANEGSESTVKEDFLYMLCLDNPEKLDLKG